MRPVPILEVTRLTTTIKLPHLARAVHNLSFNLYPGKMLAIVGESGCGKSLTALSIMQLIPDHLLASIQGSVIHRGKNLLDMTPAQLNTVRGRHISMIFQNPLASLDPLFTVAQQMEETLKTHNLWDDHTSPQHILQALEEVHIDQAEKRLHSYPHELSGGMLQRVMIAMALLCQPDILIADEPTTALDVTVQASILELLKHLQHTRKMATLLISHDLRVVSSIADEVFVMYATEKVEQAPTPQLFASPQHPYTQALLHSLPSMHHPHTTHIQGSVPPLDQLPKGCKFHPRCPQAMPKCATERPKLHTQNLCQVQCHLYEMNS